MKETGKRLEDDVNAIEKVRFILKDGIPARMTVDVPNDEGISAEKPAKAVKTKSKPVQAKSTEKVDSKATTSPAELAFQLPKKDTSTCAVGTKQSPIEITSSDSVSLDLEDIRFDYGAMIGTVTNTGETAEVKVDGHHYLNLRGRTYQLSQLHFHHPAEERIDGKGFAMSAHLVHQDAKGNKLVVAVLFDPGVSNPIVSSIWGRMPFDKNGQNPVEAGGLPITALLPEQRGYFMYSGSLTTAPCDEGVLWVVLKTPAPVSAEQISALVKLFPANARETQAINGRLVMQSK